MALQPKVPREMNACGRGRARRRALPVNRGVSHHSSNAEGQFEHSCQWGKGSASGSGGGRPFVWTALRDRTTLREKDSRSGANVSKDGGGERYQS